MKIFFSKFFYTNLISLGTYIGGKKKFKKYTNVGLCQYNEFICLDIKQSYNETNKILILLEFIMKLKGKLLVLPGSFNVIEKELCYRLFCKVPNMIVSPEANYPGMITNYYRPNYGIPALAFVADSKRSWYAVTECFSFYIPVISLCSLDVSDLIINKLTYKILSNTCSSTIFVFFFFLIKFAFLCSRLKQKHIFFNIFSFKLTKKCR